MVNANYEHLQRSINYYNANDNRFELVNEIMDNIKNCKFIYRNPYDGKFHIVPTHLLHGLSDKMLYHELEYTSYWQHKKRIISELDYSNSRRIAPVYHNTRLQQKQAEIDYDELYEDDSRLLRHIDYD